MRVCVGRDRELPLHEPSRMAARERKFFVGGNWKMNGSKESINRIISFLKEGPLSPESGGLSARDDLKN